MKKPNNQSKCKAILKFHYSTPEIAKLVDQATRQDNEFYVGTRITGKTLNAKISANTISSLLHTLDDFLKCVCIAEKIIIEQRIHKLESGANRG